ncbi:MAG: hypothetical protein KDK99_14340 [Verrucomicrobiales bacterium]|nr:hypothetical protein [Verrucomicrobiales bacterium]
MSETLSQALRGGWTFWERMRLPYNAILLALGLTWTWGLRATMSEQALFGYWGSVAAFGLVANVFYSLGPLLEGYSRVFFQRAWGSGIRWLLWTLGAATAVFLTAAFVWSMEILYSILYPSVHGASAASI